MEKKTHSFALTHKTKDYEMKDLLINSQQSLSTLKNNKIREGKSNQIYSRFGLNIMIALMLPSNLAA